MDIKSFNSFIFRYRYPIIFGVFFAVYFALAYHLVFNLHYAFGDAVTRTEKPFLVLYDNEPKLAAIGFIWPPLPSLIQLPFIAMFKGIAVYGFAGKLMTVFFGALNVGLIYLFLEKMPIKQYWRILFLVLYGLNPMIVFYAINGMSETVFLSFIILVAWNFFMWQQNRKFYHLLFIGLSLALAFLTRYETFALTASMGGLIFLTVVFFEKENNLVTKIRNGFNIALFSLLPVFATIFIWMGVNWLIMGDPLHFFHGEYSVSEQSESIGGEALATSHSIVQSAWYSYKRIALLFPIFSIVCILIVLQFRRYSWLKISMLLLAITVPLFEILIHYMGKSFGWLRFFIYIIPFTFILLSVSFSNQKKVKNIILISWIIGLVVSSIFSMRVILDSRYGKEEYSAANSLMRNEAIKNGEINYDLDIEIVKYLKNMLKPGERIMMDDFLGYGIVLNYGDPKVFINNSDKEFDSAVAFPEKYADYILIPAPNSTGIAKLDIFNRTYPKMYAEGAKYLTPVRDFGNKWRLYRVKR